MLTHGCGNIWNPRYICAGPTILYIEQLRYECVRVSIRENSIKPQVTTRSLNWYQVMKRKHFSRQEMGHVQLSSSIGAEWNISNQKSNWSQLAENTLVWICHQNWAKMQFIWYLEVKCKMRKPIGIFAKIKWPRIIDYGQVKLDSTLLCPTEQTPQEYGGSEGRRR